MLTKTLSNAKKKQRNILIKAMNDDIGSIDLAKDSWNPAQISERAKDISYIRSLVDTWNPAQLNEALRMLDLPVIDTWNPAQIEEQRRNLVFYLTERTLTGNPITLKILGNVTPEVTGLKVTMNPIQDLSHGDPSPTNICPISGRTEVSVTRTGKNLFDKTAKDTSKGYLANRYLTDTGGQIQPGSGNWYISEYMECGANTGYTLTGLSTTESNAPCLGFYSSNKTYISSLQYRNEGTKTFTTPSNAAYIRISVGPNATQEDNIILLETGKIQTHTHQYSETIYGGVDDFVNGGATSTMGMVDLGTLTWTKQTGATKKTYFRTANEVGDMKKNTSPILTQGLLCSSYPEDTWTHTVDAQGYNGTICVGWINKSYIAIYDESKNEMTAEQFKTAMDGVQLCYELATPTTIETSAEEIILLKGTNVLSTDGDSIELKYKQNF